MSMSLDQSAFNLAKTHLFEMWVWRETDEKKKLSEDDQGKKVGGRGLITSLALWQSELEVGFQLST